MSASTLDNIRDSIRTERLRRSKTGAEDFAGAVQELAANQNRTNVMHDAGNAGMLALGLGGAAAGGVGLINLLQRNRRKPKIGPGTVPLPYPVKTADLKGFLSGDNSTSASGVPWQGLAMTGATLGGLYGGWKGVGALMDSRRKSEREAELEKARQDFHDALMSNYKSPVKAPGQLEQKAAEDVPPLQKAAEALDEVFDRVVAMLTAPPTPAVPTVPGIKQALDLGNLAGQAVNGYGVYAGLSALAAGTLVHDRLKSRSQRAILEKAQQKRDRRNFMQRPTELYAVPEPAKPMVTPSTADNVKLLSQAPE